MSARKNNQGNVQQRYEEISNPAKETTKNSDFNLTVYFPLFRCMEKDDTVDSLKVTSSLY